MAARKGHSTLVRSRMASVECLFLILGREEAGFRALAFRQAGDHTVWQTPVSALYS